MASSGDANDNEIIFRPEPEQEIVIAGGEVFDPVSRGFVRQDISIRNGLVDRMAPSLEADPSAQRIDATGRIVTPGLIDAHVHAFPYGTAIGLDVDPVSSRTGVTTFIDAGSAGSLNFMAFRKFVVERTRSNLFVFLNVSAIGQVTLGVTGLEFAEYDDLRLLHLPSAVEIVQANLDVIVGIKVRMYTGLTSLTPLVVGRELADEVGLPLVVHLAPPPPSFADILPYLRPGDVITHVYHPGPGAIVGRNGRVRSEYKEARARGVLIDTGTARFHTNFPMVRAAFEQEFFPDTISTDLTPSGVGSLTIDLPTSITKYMAFGMSLNDALAAVTITPARLLPPGTGIGQLAEGMPADLGVFALEEGKFSYDDYFGNSVATSTRLVNHVTIKDGQVLVPQPTPPVEWGFVKR